MNQPVSSFPQPDRLMRLPEVLARLPMSPTTWWRGVKDGRYPASVKLGPRTTCWRASDIEKLMQQPR
jgi:predicted DNA-binding transcriptional regulator AlpA